jgi:hypothetical protein
MAGKARSPRFAGFSLRESIELLRRIADAIGDQRVSATSAAALIGYRSLSGPAKVALGALHQYGLLHRSGGDVQVSHLGQQVLSPKDHEEWRTAFRRAALMPPLFRELLEVERPISDAELAEFLKSRKFIAEGVRRFTRAFRGTEAALKEAASPTLGALTAFQQRSPQALTLQIPLGPGTLFVEIRYSSGPVTAEHIDFVRQQLDTVERRLRSV